MDVEYVWYGAVVIAYKQVFRYSKNVFFLIFQPKHVSTRRFFWAPKTNAWTDG